MVILNQILFLFQDMQLSNHKLIDRGVKMIQNELSISKEEALNFT